MSAANTHFFSHKLKHTKKRGVQKQKQKIKNSQHLPTNPQQPTQHLTHIDTSPCVKPNPSIKTKTSNDTTLSAHTPTSSTKKTKFNHLSVLSVNTQGGLIKQSDRNCKYQKLLHHLRIYDVSIAFLQEPYVNSKTN